MNQTLLNTGFTKRVKRKCGGVSLKISGFNDQVNCISKESERTENLNLMLVK